MKYDILWPVLRQLNNRQAVSLFIKSTDESSRINTEAEPFKLDITFRKTNYLFTDVSFLLPSQLLQSI